MIQARNRWWNRIPVLAATASFGLHIISFTSPTLYVLLHLLSACLAAASVLVFWANSWKNKSQVPKRVLAILLCSAGLVIGSQLLFVSYGSPEGSLGDIGGTPLWLFGGIALIVISLTSREHPYPLTN